MTQQLKQNRSDRFPFLMVSFVILAILLSLFLTIYQFPVAQDSPSFTPVLLRRFKSVLTMFLTAVSQSIAVLVFQLIGQNRLLTPSIMGLDGLYQFLYTGLVYIGGLYLLLKTDTNLFFVFQVAFISLISICLYIPLLRYRNLGIQKLLLIGFMLSFALNSASQFMRRLLAPAEFDVLQARLLSSFNQPDWSELLIAIVIILVCIIFWLSLGKQLDILQLGESISRSLGINYQRLLQYCLIIVIILQTLSNSLVGPLRFYGFLIANAVDLLFPGHSHDHQVAYASLIGFNFLLISQIFSQTIFKGTVPVSLIIECLGGISFIFLLLRRQRYDSTHPSL